MSRRIKKRKLEVEEQKINDGEQDNFFPDKAREEMETMWEIPQICHFLHLTKESLNIPQLSMYEMERMLLIPRASRQLANVMTCLLSSPITKAKLHKVPSMPYEFWTNILTHKMVCWFKVYHSKHKDPIKVLDSIGVEPEFWSLFPDGSSLDGKDFEDLNFKQRVWLLKTVCDTIMHTRKAVQEDIAKQPWLYQFETVLGFDRYGARYIYFPQFLPNDFRIYRQCLDNKILSTVEPVKSEQESEKAKSFKSNIITARINRYRKGKSQYYNNSSDHKSNRREDKSNEDRKDLNSFKCSNDSAVNSFISEDTNLSSTSTCSNNNVNKEAKRKRCRSLSKTSDESTLSNARSSGYDTTTSSEKSVFDESSQMFKGFANTETNNCRIGIIKEMLNDLKSEIDEEKKASERESNSDSELESKDNSTILSCKSTTDSCNGPLICEKDETKSFWDNLSSSLKTDDEKLKEIINSSGGSKLPENMYLKSLSAGDDFSDSSTITCKSDDEKLSETKNSDSTLSAIETNDRKVTFIRSFCASSSSSESLNKDATRRERFASKTKISQSIIETELNDSEETETVPRRNLRKRTRLRSHYKRVQSEINADKKESKTADAMKDEGKTLRDETDIKSDTEDSDDSANNSDIRYNLRNSNDPKTGECREHFNKLLSDLSVSDFHLVADSVDGLRDLISVFKTCNSETDNADGTKDTRETKLMEKLTELLNNVESVETIVKDATRKARAKLQREWFNFKEGAGIHCQLLETQRYKRYRDLPYPHLAPKTPSRHQPKTKMRTRSRTTTSRVAAIAGERTTNDETAETVRNRRELKHHRKETSRSRNRRRSKRTSKMKKQKPRRSTKIQSNRRDEYCERAASPRTRNSFIRTTRPTRTSWKNGPTLRQSTRLPAHRQIHPLLTLLPRSDTLTTGRSRRTQIKIGFYRALAKGKINVRLPIED